MTKTKKTLAAAALVAAAATSAAVLSGGANPAIAQLCKHVPSYAHRHAALCGQVR